MDCLCLLIICTCPGLKPRANQGDCNMRGTKLKISRRKKAVEPNVQDKVRDFTKF